MSHVCAWGCINIQSTYTVMRPTVARCAIVKDNFSTEQVTKIYENSWEFTDIYVTNGVQVNITYGPNQRVVQTLD